MRSSASLWRLRWGLRLILKPGAVFAVEIGHDRLFRFPGIEPVTDPLRQLPSPPVTRDSVVIAELSRDPAGSDDVPGPGF